MLDRNNKKDIIARRIAMNFRRGDIVNLGVGIPVLSGNYMKDGVWIQSENGLLGVGRQSSGIWKQESFCNAAGQEVQTVKGACSFDIATSFGMIRKGRVTATVLGCLQVAANGDIANWQMPNHSPGMGGAMDLVSGVKRVYVATLHNTKSGEPKILERCTLRLTGAGCVHEIITERCTFLVTPEGLQLVEIVEGEDIEEIRKLTGAPFTVADKLLEYRFAEHENK